MLLAAQALGFTLPSGVALVLWLIILVSSAMSSASLYHDVFIVANVVEKGDCIPHLNTNLQCLVPSPSKVPRP
jgi:hypothetical protein